MRIALLILAVTALAFIGSIIWIFATKNGINLIPQKINSETKISNETTALEILRSQWKTEERIKNLEAKIDALGEKDSILSPLQVTSEGTGGIENPKTITSSVTGSVIIPISAKFLTKVIAKVNLLLIKNNGVYGLYIFDTNTVYSTYTDSKYNITIIASKTPYETWLKNFQSFDTSLYKVNETKTFLFPSFYLNTVKSDEVVRIVMKVETQTLLISIAKNRFNEFKTLMTKK